MVGVTGFESANLPVPNRTLYQAELHPVTCMARRPGLEPGMKGSKPLVLPLHHRRICGGDTRNRTENCRMQIYRDPNFTISPMCLYIIAPLQGLSTLVYKMALMAERVGFEPTVLSHTPLAGERLQPLGYLSENGGECRIRTHGASRHARFQVECFQPDSANSP